MYVALNDHVPTRGWSGLVPVGAPSPAHVSAEGPGPQRPVITYSGIGDEAGASLGDQLDALAELGWNSIELRTVDGQSLARLDDRAFIRVADALRRRGMAVACVASQIGGWSRPITGDFSHDLDELAILLHRCSALGSPYIRIMSYPNAGLDEPEWGRRAVRRVGELARRAERAGVILLHENCVGWARARADRMLLLLDAAGSALRLLFDTGNGIAHGYDAYELLSQIVGHVEHVHVKDAEICAGKVVYTLPGRGAARVAESLRLIASSGYAGSWSIEPHLSLRPHEPRGPATGCRETFVAFGVALERLLCEGGFSGLKALQPEPDPSSADGRASPPPPVDPPASCHSGTLPPYISESSYVPGALPTTVRLAEADCDLLVRLLRTPTAGQLETGRRGPRPRLWEAQRAYAAAAAALGFLPVYHAVPTPAEVTCGTVPTPVARALAEIPGFLESQPSLVLRLGAQAPREATVMFNVHLDTVDPMEPGWFDGVRFHGRGAIDAKGPAVGLLAGIRAALKSEPTIRSRMSILIQVVSGEEGGAMGTIGTRPLVRRGFVGRLNLFCEPTSLRYLPRATAAMTARVTIEGRDGIDDRPERAHNATVLLGFLAQHLGLALGGQRGSRVCVGGIHTGRLHNRVYGAGELLVNVAYDSEDAGRRLESVFAAALADGVTEFTRRFSSTPAFALTAAEAASVTCLQWLKQGLPALAGRDPWYEGLLEDAGVARWPDENPAFTCDAIWMHDVAGAFTVVLGPGDLAANNAHGSGEFAELADLEAYASAIARILVGFCRSRPAGKPCG